MGHWGGWALWAPVAAAFMYLSETQAFLAPATPCSTPPRLRWARIALERWQIRHARVGRRSCILRLLQASSGQDVETGVMLPPSEAAPEYASFLADAIRKHLDEEWIPQEVHKGIAAKVGEIYTGCIQQGVADLTSVVMEVGSGLETFDMGDAFVGPWDVANLASDFIMAKVGAETCHCSTPVPQGQGQDQEQEAGGAGAASAGSAPNAFPFAAEDIARLKEGLASQFNRYRFLGDFMDDMVPWPEANLVVAVCLGYGPGDDHSGVNRPEWVRRFPGRMPALEAAGKEGEDAVALLERDYPSDPDALQGLEDFVGMVYGDEAKKIAEGKGEAGIPAKEGYPRRAAVVKWLYAVGFLERPLGRADPEPEDEDEDDSP